MHLSSQASHSCQLLSEVCLCKSRRQGCRALCTGAAVNIGDALMRWSDDKLKSNYHRVRMPVPGEDQGSRYSIAYFNQVSIFSEEPEDGSCCFSRHRLTALDGGSSVVTVLQPPVRCFVSPDWQSQKLKQTQLPDRLFLRDGGVSSERWCALRPTRALSSLARRGATLPSPPRTL